MLEGKLREVGNKNACPMAIMYSQGKILTGLRNYKADCSVWTIPGGRCEIGETLKQTLRREVFEEVGITEFEIVDFLTEAPGISDGDVLQIFFCTTNQEAKLMEPQKFSCWKWLPVEEYVTNEKYCGFNQPARKIIENFLISRFLLHI